MNAYVRVNKVWILKTNIFVNNPDNNNNDILLYFLLV